QAQVSYLSHKIDDNGFTVPDVAMISAVVPPTENQEYAIVGSKEPLPNAPNREINYADVAPRASLTLVSNRQAFLGEFLSWEVLETGPALTVWKGWTTFKNDKLRAN